MRIAHIVCTYPPYYSGMGNVVLEAVSQLRKLGHEIAVFTPMYIEVPPKEEYTPEMKEQVEYAKRLKPSIQYGKAARLPKIHRELQDYDLVHLHYPFYGTANLVRRWKLKNPEKPFVVTYHMDTRGPGFKGLVFKYYSKYWMPRILNSADLLIGSSFDYISSSNARDLYKQNPEKWIELPFGVDVERFKPREKPGELFLRHELNTKKPTVIFVGGMDKAHYFKGIPVLLKALLLSKQQGLDVQAIFVGEGELREQFELQSRGMGLSKSVKFSGKVSYEELPYYYNMADLLILPSIHEGEAFGTVLLEAMASGVPVIASNLPGVRKVAKKGGLIFQPKNSQELAEKILGFFSDKTEKQEWRKRVREAAIQEYSWETIIARLESEYKKLV